MKLGSVPGLVTIPEGADPIVARIEKVAQHGLQVLGLFLRPEMRDADSLKRAAEVAQRRGVELRLGTGGSFYLEGHDARAEAERVAADLRSERNLNPFVTTRSR
jgi:sugar phosphate isomerase/epimerase